MTKAEIEEMLREMDVPFRYDHFTQKEMQDIELPIIVWMMPGTDNFFADGQVYKKIQRVQIELYTDSKNWFLEEKLENILNNHGIAWQQVESTWLQTESMWGTFYEVEV